MALLTALGLATVACGQTGGTAASGRSSGSSAAATSSAPRSPETTSHPAADLQAILLRALTNEHAAKATYDHILVTLGQVAPFTQAASAEQRRIAELERVARTHKVDVAGVTAAGSSAPATRAQACQLGVATEKATVALYDQLLPQVSAYPDVRLVFHNLRAAAQDNHLPRASAAPDRRGGNRRAKTAPCPSPLSPTPPSIPSGAIRRCRGLGEPWWAWVSPRSARLAHRRSPAGPCPAGEEGPATASGVSGGEPTDTRRGYRYDPLPYPSGARSWRNSAPTSPRGVN